MSDSREEATVDQLPDLDPDTILPISHKEQHALDLYDKIQELRLEIAIIKAQQSIQGRPHILFSETCDHKVRIGHRIDEA